MKLLYSKWIRSNGEGKLVWLVYKGGEKKVVVDDFPFLPYCFVRKKDLGNIPKEVLYGFNVETDVNAITYRDEPVVKIEANLPSDIGWLRQKLEALGIPVYEADIPYAKKRVLIDLGSGYDIPEKVLFYDIEVDSRVGFPRPERPTQRILTIAAMSYSGKEYFFSYEDERRTVREFLEVARRYEVLSGWNVSGFDWPYIVARAERLGMRIDSFLYPHIDLYFVYREVFKRKQESYALSAVAKKILGREIEDWGIEGKVHLMYEMWKSNLGELKNYTMKQVECTKDIDLELQLIKMRSEICKLACIPPYTESRRNADGTWEVQMLKNSSIIDGLILRRSIERAEKEGVPRIVFPSKRKFVEDEEEVTEYQGGAVKDPEPGLHEGVAVLDFASTYPAIIQTFNVGLDTWRDEKLPDAIYAKHGCFIKYRNSLASEVVGLLVSLRQQYKKKRNEYHPDSKEYKIYDGLQFGVKFTANSFYGVMGFESSRYYRWEIAENITSYSRSLLYAAVAWFCRKYHVLYYDTDGFFIKPKFEYKNFEQLLEQIYADLDGFREHLKEFVLTVYNVPESRYTIDLKLDRLFSKLYLTTKKKRYCSKSVYEDNKWIEPYIHVKGFEVVRSDWPDISKIVQSQLMELILDGRINEISKFLREVEQKLLDGEYDELLYVRKGLSQPIEEYKNETPHVTAAKLMMKRGIGVRVGDKIKYIDASTDRCRRILLDHRELTREDRRAIFEKFVRPIVDRFELQRYTQSTLDKFWR